MTQHIRALFDLPFNDLLFQAHQMHRQHWDVNEIQLSTLLSIKTGGCEEDCKYCSQSMHYKTDVKADKLMDEKKVVMLAERAKKAGATRFCMSAAWRQTKDRDLPKLTTMIKKVKSLGLETCMTAGMLTDTQAKELKGAGLDYYNHNLDTSRDYYKNIITTRTYDDRLNTLQNVREAGMKVCCGGIVGLGEERSDRADFLETLANLDPQPESVPLNMLVPVKGTPMENATTLDPIELVRTIAVARLLMPKSYLRLSAGRTEMSKEMQALCFFAGANSLFYGDHLLTTDNPTHNEDVALFEALGLKAGERSVHHS